VRRLLGRFIFALLQSFPGEFKNFSARVFRYGSHLVRFATKISRPNHANKAFRLFLCRHDPSPRFTYLTLTLAGNYWRGHRLCIHLSDLRVNVSNQNRVWSFTQRQVKSPVLIRRDDHTPLCERNMITIPKRLEHQNEFSTVEFHRP
jgi:hypothetical protein